jgi:cell division protein FtsQ
VADVDTRAAARRQVSAGRIVARRLGVLAVVGIAVWVVWFSPLFALRGEEISVSSDGVLVDLAAARQVVEPFVGTPLTRLDPSEVEAALGTVPGVLDSQVVRSWPHGLSVEIVERIPVAAVADSSQGYLLVDIEGVELAVSAQPPDGLPVVTVPVGEDNSRVLAAALAAAAALPPDLAIRIEAIRAETEDSVTLFVKDGPRIEWGGAEDSTLKARVVEVLLSSDGEAAAVIDVSAPTLVVTRDG